MTRAGNVDALAHAEQAIEGGSSSFAAAARLFDPATRESTLLLYAWCRHCDDVVDGQHLGRGQRPGTSRESPECLHALEEQTRRACAGQSSDHPAFEGLRQVARRHQFDAALPLEHLAGFRMDVEHVHYETIADTLLYCYRVAGVVGLMMARVMGAREQSALDRACDLGIAFQLTNIARDIVEDAAIGRIYLPDDWLAEAGVPKRSLVDLRHRDALAHVAARLVETADPYYESALAGLAALPLRSAWSVATARDAYRAIGHHVKSLGGHAWDARVSTSGREKIWFALRGAAVALAARSLPMRNRNDYLWRRPV